MNKEALNKLRTPLRIALSISLFVAGICLCAACVGIYRSGDQPFSRESVAAAFGPISLPVYLCLGLLLLTVIFELALPSPSEKKPPVRQTRMLLRRLQERTDLSLCSEELRKEVLALRADRRLFDRIGWTVLVISSVLFLIYGTNPDNFHSTQINDSMIRAMYWLIPCSIVPFCYGIFAGYRNLGSMKKELELLKSAPKESKILPHRHHGSNKKLLILRTAFVVIALVCLIGGFFAGGTADVLTKAVNICTECVGLG